VCRLRAPIKARLSKEGCISLDAEVGHLALHIGMTETNVAPFQPEKHTPPKWGY